MMGVFDVLVEIEINKILEYYLNVKNINDIEINKNHFYKYIDELFLDEKRKDNFKNIASNLFQRKKLELIKS